MAGPGALLLLGGLLGGLPGGLPQSRGGAGGAGGGPESPPELEEEVSIVQRSDPSPPHCFSRTLHDLSCFWDSPGDPDPRRYRLQFRLEQDPWQECPLSVTALAPARGSRFWCSLPPAATVTFVPLELRVLPATPGTPPETTQRPPETTEGPPKTTETTKRPPETTGTTTSPPKTAKTAETTRTPPTTSETTETTGTPPKTTETPESPPKTTGSPPETTTSPPKTSGTTRTPPEAPETTGPPPEPPPLFQRTIFIDQVVLPGPPQNVSVSAGGARGELCVRWAPPPGPYLHSSLVFELALSPPGGPPKTVGVPAGRREQRVGGLRASTPYAVRARARPDGLSYGGFWSPWSPPGSATTPPELDAVTLGLSCLLVLLLLGLGALGLLGHRRTLRAKLWPPVPGPEREFEGLFSNYGGNFQLWLCQGPGSPRAPPSLPSPPAELEEAVEEVGGGAAAAPPPPSAPPAGPSPPASFEYTLLLGPGSALLGPAPRPAPYANLDTPPKGEGRAGAGHAPHYVICS